MKNSKLLFNLLSISFFLIFLSCEKDDETAAPKKSYYQDLDGDGYGNHLVLLRSDTQPAGYVDNDDDLDDTNAAIFPGCERITYYLDTDEDGSGDPNNFIIICGNAPEGYVANDLDCNDTNADVFDGSTTEVPYYLDDDGDGYGDPTMEQIVQGCPLPENYVTNDQDLDDTDAGINPETLIFRDSDGDERGNPLESKTLESLDELGDYVLNDLDCDDTDPAIYSDSEEIIGDKIDNNCDGISGIVWDGPIKEVNRPDNPADFLQYLDTISENIILGRKFRGPIFNVAWWDKNFGDLNQFPTHNDATSSDLVAELTNDGLAAILPIAEISPQGGTKGLRWAILAEDTGGSTFDFPYNKPGGDVNDYYSFHNVVSALTAINLGGEPLLSLSNHEIAVKFPQGSQKYRDYDMTTLIGVTLVGYDAENEVSFTFKIIQYTPDDVDGGGIIYERSTPPVEEEEEEPED